MKEGGGELIRVEPLHPAATPLMPPLLHKNTITSKKTFQKINATKR
jgi:hypothetical protein